jgi:ATP/maltotriose-dependent transcriptional regulator MalT
VHAAASGLDVGIVELLAGDPAAAEREVRADLEFLDRRGEKFFFSAMAGLLARAVREQGRDDEALVLTETAERAASEHDLVVQSVWRSVRAPILARAGQLDAAEVLAREALDLARKTGFPILEADVLFDLAVVHQLSGRQEDARSTLAQARAIHEAKADRTSLARLDTWQSEVLGQ